MQQPRQSDRARLHASGGPTGRLSLQGV